MSYKEKREMELKKEAEEKAAKAAAEVSHNDILLPRLLWRRTRRKWVRTLSKYSRAPSYKIDNEPKLFPLMNMTNQSFMAN